MPWFKPFRLAPVAVAALLTACAGGGNGNTDGATTDPDEPTTASFSSEPVLWQFVEPAEGSALCFDFDLAAAVDCSDGSGWDLRFDGNLQLWSNGGVSGVGSGAAFGLLSWTELLGWTQATLDPVSGEDVSAHYFEDSASSIFSSAGWYAYNLTGSHQLHPNYRVYLINSAPGDRSAREYALQVVGYYGGSGGTSSGYPSLRWVDRSAPDSLHELTVDASSDQRWVYLSLQTGEILALDDASAAESSAWDIALRRYEIKLNGGSSGPGGTGGYLGATPEGLYDADGLPITEAFLAITPEDTLYLLTDDGLSEPATPYAWVSDSVSSVLNPGYSGTYPQPLDYGWYTYYPSTHFIDANVDAGALLRGDGGESYARFHVGAIDYADPADASSQRSWTLEFNVQAAAE